MDGNALAGPQRSVEHGPELLKPGEFQRIIPYDARVVALNFPDGEQPGPSEARDVR